MCQSLCICPTDMLVHLRLDLFERKRQPLTIETNHKHGKVLQNVIRGPSCHSFMLEEPSFLSRAELYSVFAYPLLLTFSFCFLVWFGYRQVLCTALNAVEFAYYFHCRFGILNVLNEDIFCYLNIFPPFFTFLD